MVPNPAIAGRRRGMSLIDTALALVVTSIALIGMTQMAGLSGSQTKDSAAASTLGYVGLAAQSYLLALNTTLLGCQSSTSATPLVIPVGRLTAGGAQPSVLPAGSPCATNPSIKTIQSAGYLPTDFVDTDAWGQHHALLVKNLGTSLDAMVVTYGPTTSTAYQQKVGPTDTDLGAMASKVGVQGGFYPQHTIGSLPSKTIAGAYGGWQEPATAWNVTMPDSSSGPSVQHIAYNLGFQNAATNDYLYRDWTGVALQNTMDTDIYMNGAGSRHGLRGVANIDVQTLNNTDGSNAITIEAGDTFVYGNVDITENSALSFSTYGGGWYMSDTTAVRAFANKNISTGGKMLAGSFVDDTNTAYYLTPSSVSNINALNVAGAEVVGTTLSAGTSITAPVYRDFSGAIYYMTPSGTSNLNQVNSQNINDAGHLEVAGFSILNGVVYAENGAVVTGNLFSGNVIAAGSVWGSLLATSNSAWVGNNLLVGDNGGSWINLDGSSGSVSAGGSVSANTVSARSGMQVGWAGAVAGGACSESSMVVQSSIQAGLFWCNGATWQKVTVTP